MNIPIGYSAAGMSWPLFVPDGAGGYPTTGYIRSQYFAAATDLWVGAYAAGSYAAIINQTGASIIFGPAAGFSTIFRGYDTQLTSAVQTYISSGGSTYLYANALVYVNGAAGVNIAATSGDVSIAPAAGKTSTTTGQRDNVTDTTANPYTALQTDYLIACNHAAAHGGVTVNLPATRADGDVYRVKLNGNFDAANPCTIQDAAGTKNIDGAATLVLGAAYKCAHLMWSATRDEWMIVSVY